MSMQDPISDLLTRIRNGYAAKKEFVIVYSSKLKLSIINLLKDERFLDDYFLINDNVKKPKMKIFLKYYNKDVPMIKKIVRISKPGVRVYKNKNDLPKVLNGFGIAIVSTSVGLLTDNRARELGLGGEVICTVE
ncbi:MAG: 30S ribosomal protein S8 [Enterobacteriaceae bacterium]|nr:30S ribosomal protein S8 [Enterobacteriaceae bacterium]